MIRFKATLIVLILVSFLVSAIGCGPTYPKEKFKESIIRICKKEYKLDVKVITVGKTIAIYAPLPDLLDFTFAITQTASEKINDVILSVSRVALSSDANYDFYCVIAHDIRIPEIQIVIIKSVDDVKRFLLNDISRGDYSKRMLVDLRLNPQAQKEHAIKEVFEKMGLDRQWQDNVMNDFFRSEPMVLGDIGYWNGRFYIKDVTLSEFLTEQIANRIKIEFRENKDLASNFIVRSAKGSYLSKQNKGYFKLELLVVPKWLKEFGGEADTAKVFQAAMDVASQVIHGYDFKNFDFLEVVNESDGKILRVPKNELDAFRRKKIKLEDILKEYMAL